LLKNLGGKVILYKANIPNPIGNGMLCYQFKTVYRVGPLSPVGFGVTIALNLSVVTLGQVLAVTVMVLF
jgi:hypothetical protein